MQTLLANLAEVAVRDILQVYLPGLRGCAHTNQLEDVAVGNQIAILVHTLNSLTDDEGRTSALPRLGTDFDQTLPSDHR